MDPPSGRRGASAAREREVAGEAGRPCAARPQELDEPDDPEALDDSALLDEEDPESDDDDVPESEDEDVPASDGFEERAPDFDEARLSVL
jgi:hypothetical protein